MAVTYSFDGSILRVDFVGVYQPQDVIDAFDRALADPRISDDSCLLIDVTRSDSLADRPVDDLRRLTDSVGVRAVRIARRCAILAKSDVHFGLMRMATVFAEAHNVESMVFKVEKDAVAWLRSSLAGTLD